MTRDGLHALSHRANFVQFGQEDMYVGFGAQRFFDAHALCRSIDLDEDVLDNLQARARVACVSDGKAQQWILASLGQTHQDVDCVRSGLESPQKHVCSDFKVDLIVEVGLDSVFSEEGAHLELGPDLDAICLGCADKADIVRLEPYDTSRRDLLNRLYDSDQGIDVDKRGAEAHCRGG